MKTLKPKKPDRRPAGDHSYADLYNKAEAALRNPEFIKIAILADSPNAAETAGRSQGLHWHIRRMIHALARIKRDYPKQFWNMDTENIYARRNTVADTIRFKAKEQRNRLALFLGQHRSLRTARAGNGDPAFRGTDTGQQACGNWHIFRIPRGQGWAGNRKHASRLIHLKGKQQTFSQAAYLYFPSPLRVA